MVNGDVPTSNKFNYYIPPKRVNGCAIVEVEERKAKKTEFIPIDKFHPHQRTGVGRKYTLSDCVCRRGMETFPGLPE